MKKVLVLLLLLSMNALWADNSKNLIGTWNIDIEKTKNTKTFKALKPQFAEAIKYMKGVKVEFDSTGNFTMMMAGSKDQISYKAAAGKGKNQLNITATLKDKAAGKKYLIVTFDGKDSITISNANEKFEVVKTAYDFPLVFARASK